MIVLDSHCWRQSTGPIPHLQTQLRRYGIVLQLFHELQEQINSLLTSHGINKWARKPCHTWTYAASSRLQTRSIYAASPLMHICKARARERGGGFYGRAQLQPFLCCWEDYCLQCVGSAATLRPIDWSPGLMLCWGTGCHIDLRRSDMRWQWDLLDWGKYRPYEHFGGGEVWSVMW